jgi:phospholipid-binding lipoprotein MlaA
VLETAAIDPYVFLRDAYLQRRRALIYDGKPPVEEEEEDTEEPAAAPQSTPKP